MALVKPSVLTFAVVEQLELSSNAPR